MFALNRSSNRHKPLRPHLLKMLGTTGLSEVKALLSLCPAYEPTHLHSLPEAAQRLGVASLAIKDESTRLGLGSFKALGGAYAVSRLVMRIASARLGRSIEPYELYSEDVRSISNSITVGCATDGNHGRSVAAGAQLLGVTAKIFVHSGVSSRRCDEMSRLGAQIVHVEGSYDDSVTYALEACQRNGWDLVSDTSWPGYEDVPLEVMQGYSVVMDEALAQLAEPPTHVFLQAGVGGFAASAATFMKDKLGDDCPTIVIVEPSRAACIFESNIADQAVRVRHGQPTVMAMLECYEPSMVAWEVLSRLSDAFMTIEEEDAINAMRQLASPLFGDPAIVAGESGGVGYMAMTIATANSEFSNLIGLGRESRVLVVNTEGATDPEIYWRCVGKSAAAVLLQNERAA